ncbi:hypothetical protein OSB04_028027 [Centaurea solstitialis]|uniref:Uncharacterized protein n=1 Tax=Centaurea solstitialis TaxID=347529 RepID=A0AA38WAS0_9ASTR|nr:hypothetical protein OSB04_028027 [Centaurea solstitialis]
MIRRFNMDQAHTTSTPMIGQVLDIRKYLFRLKEDKRRGLTSEASDSQSFWQPSQSLWFTRSYSLFSDGGSVIALSEPLPVVLISLCKYRGVSVQTLFDLIHPILFNPQNLYPGLTSEPNLGLQMFPKSKIFLKDHIQQIHRGLSSVSNTEFSCTSCRQKPLLQQNLYAHPSEPSHI